MFVDKSVLEQALEALEAMQSYAAAERKGLRICDEAIPALRAALAQQAEPVQEKNSAPEKLPVPKEWYTKLALTSFTRSINGEGSYYCPHCDTNAGTVWVDHAWRPTKWQAICYNCRELFEE